MRIRTYLRHAIAASVTISLAVGTPVVHAQSKRQSARVGRLPVGTQRPTREVVLSVGEAELINLPAAAANVFTSNPAAADVFVNSDRQIHLFGKATGNATIFATSASGAVIYSAVVQVSDNLTSIDRMMKAAMPEANIRVTTVGQLAIINGTVTSPRDSEEAQRLVTTLLNPGIDTSQPNAQLKMLVVNRLKNATPQQVNLQVRISEVSRSFLKDVGVNLKTRDQTGGFLFGIGSGSRSPGEITTPTLNFPTLDASALYGLPAGSISLPFNPATGKFVIPGTGSQFGFDRGTANTALGAAGKLFGMDVLAALDLGETLNQVTTLSNPNLTALSGETASFLAGGEIPIPISSGLGTVSVEYKQYGVSLAYTPTVLEDGRISLRVRPEVSELAGNVIIAGSSIPGITTRRAETTVELGSGQSLVIGGLLQNNHNNTIEKAPGLGDVPILGSLFRSNSFRRGETELVIVVTPYLVKPVNANDIVLPTDGYKAPTDLERIFLGKMGGGTSGADRPKPSMGAPSGAAPALGSGAPVQQPAPPPPATDRRRDDKNPAPGFSN